MDPPSPEILLASAIAYLRGKYSDREADILSRCKLDIKSIQKYNYTTKIGLNITLRCKTADFDCLRDQGFLQASTDEMLSIKEAIEAVLAIEFQINDISARTFLVDRSEIEKTETERLIELQKGLMIAVATGGPKIQTRNSEYKDRRKLISEKLTEIGLNDPNPFDDLWVWYGRWSSGDLQTYQSRREYINQLYQPLLETIITGMNDNNLREPVYEPTGWERVDRVIDSIISGLPKATTEEDFQSIGLLCRECLISLAQAVYDPTTHKNDDSIEPSKTDANRMLEAYFSFEFSGNTNEVLRKHSKAALALAVELQHRRTANYKHAALCSEATRTVVNIVAITSGKK